MDKQIIATCVAMSVGPSLYLVIPKEIREYLNIQSGDDFIVYYDPKLGIIYQKRKENLSRKELKQVGVSRKT